MSGFKLLAIRPLPEIEFHLKNNLSHREVYSFYNEYGYTFENDDKDKEITHVTKPQDYLPDLYSIKYDDKKIDINICAMVGMNGSGKSSILEMLYSFCFILSRDEPEMIDASIQFKGHSAYLERSITNITNTLRLEVFFEQDGLVRSLKYDGINIKYYEFATEREEKDYLDSSQFCYSIALNYSLYGLNEKHNPYLHLLFHKNDGYQSPLVINPMRENGNIDVNKEFDLSQARVLLNLAKSKMNTIEIVTSKFVSQINFEIRPSELISIKTSSGEIDLKSIINTHKDKHGENVYLLVNKLIVKLYGKKYQLSEVEIVSYLALNDVGLYEFVQTELKNIKTKPVEIENLKYLLVGYIIKKIFKICMNYSGMKEKFMELDFYTEKISHPAPWLKIDSLSKLVKELIEDKSHMTFKLKQAIYMLVNNTLSEFNWSRYEYIPKSDSETLDERVVNALNVFKFKGNVEIAGLLKSEDIKPLNMEFFSDVHAVPGSFVKPYMYYSLKNGMNSPTLKMSSGEQQFFQSLNSVLYHLRNLDSIQGSILEKQKVYKNANIILDEIELYYHPDYQRSYLSELLRNIEQLKLKNIDSINILFSTHSPFILSDIPAQNILRLEEGKVSGKEFGETFGANIHDLLANDFFLDDGFMGQFAKERIEDLIKYLRYQPNEKESKSNVKPKDAWDGAKAKEIISIVGEPILQMKLSEMYDIKFKVEFEIELLKKRIKDIEEGRHRVE